MMICTHPTDAHGHCEQCDPVEDVTVTEESREWVCCDCFTRAVGPTRPTCLECERPMSEGGILGKAPPQRVPLPVLRAALRDVDVITAAVQHGSDAVECLRRAALLAEGDLDGRLELVTRAQIEFSLAENLADALGKGITLRQRTEEVDRG